MTDEDQTSPRTFGALAKALAAFQSEAPAIAKNKTASIRSDKGSYSYSYADLADIAEQAYPIMAKNGLAFTAIPDHGVLTGMLIHESGEYVSGSLPISGSRMQEIGSSLTYCRRYLLGCLTGIVTDDDEDGAIANSAKPRAAKKAAAPRRDPAIAERIDKMGSEPERQAAPLGGRTEKQAKMLAVQMKQAGLTDRDEALSYFSGLIGRQLESTKDLTVAEASKVIDTLVDANKQGANPTTGEQRNYGGEDPWGAQ